ncbi:MAG TPA: GspH/FimT family pseudopilin [Candidatus Sulfotelmatobacter sp.]|nr:GspH/FimT family pseudopilin [Candidatus Sulfotelmatobacter sp.]
MSIRRRDGFSLIELVIVVAIVLIVTAIAVPNFTTAYNNIRLRSAANDLAGLIQQARMRSQKTNTIITINYAGQQAFIDLNNNGNLDQFEPVITFPGNIAAFQGAAPTPYVLVGDTGNVVYNNPTVLGYSTRGLPCVFAAGACPAPAGGYFVYYLQDQRANGQVGWAAVVVSRSGRSKSVVWTGNSWQ